MAEAKRDFEKLEPGTFKKIGAFVLTEIHRTAIIPLEINDIPAFKKLQADLNGRVKGLTEASDTDSEIAFAEGVSGVAVYGKFGESAVKLETESRMAQLACALERYHLQHNSYPDTLAALTPDFLIEVPLDPVNGNPLHYRPLRKSYKLNSVAWDTIDHAGTKDDDWSWSNP